MPLSLQGQVAIVTGASSGIGTACAEALAAAGAAVIVNYRSGPERAQEVVDTIAAAGGHAHAVEADVADEKAVCRLFDVARDVFGGVDIVVANSGLQRDKPIAELGLDDWNQVIGVNLTGQFLCVREAVRRFRGQGDRGLSRARGKIICMSSVHEIIPWAGHVNYAASKGGVLQMMRSVAQEVAPERIRVNGVAPGAIRTSINQDALAGEGAERAMQLIPYGRIGDGDDVGRVVAFLASDDADFVVGTTIFVDGGMTLYPDFRDNG